MTDTPISTITNTQKIEAVAKKEAGKFWLWVKKGTHYAVPLAGLFGLLWLLAITFNHSTAETKALDGRVDALEARIVVLEHPAPVKAVKLHKRAQ